MLWCNKVTIGVTNRCSNDTKVPVKPPRDTVMTITLNIMKHCYQCSYCNDISLPPEPLSDILMIL